MTLRAHHLVVSLLVGAVALSSAAVLTVNPRAAQAACASGSSVLITSPTNTTSAPLAGIVTLKAQALPSATTASGLSFMLYPTQQAIGEATLAGTTWSLSWDTRNQANGTAQLVAIAHFGSVPTLDCASQVMPINIANTATQAPHLSGNITPLSWQGPVGTSTPFTLDAIYTDQYGRLSHVSPTGVNWHSALGTVSPATAVNTVFMAGSVLGSGTIIADFGYSGIAGQATAGIKVTPSGTSSSTGSTTAPTPTTPPATPHPTSTTTASLPAPTPTPTPLTTADATRLAAMPTIFRPAAPTNSDPIVSLPTLSCLEKAVGTVRFSEISGGKSQPTAAERALAAACFSGTEPIPALLAPVAPTHITELTTANTNFVSLASVTNHTTTGSDGKQVKGLLLSGTGAPNTNIFIYMFSDPLVLRAQTDGSGKWSYVLDTPLKAGHHEVYAVAEKDAGTFVRTSAVPLSIASAASGSQDGSLVVEGGWSSAQLGFAGGAALLVLAAIGVFFSILRRRRKLAAAPAAAPATDSALPSATVIMPVAVTPAVPAPPAPAPAASAPVSSPPDSSLPTSPLPETPPTPTPPTPTPPAPPIAEPVTSPAPAAPTETPSGHDAQV